MRFHLTICCLLLGICTTGSNSSTSSPDVTVELRSSWPASYPLLESLETISEEELDAFFPLLDAFTNPEIIPASLNDTAGALCTFAFDTALSEGYLTEPGSYASAEMALALHIATPKIEAFYQFYVDHVRNVDIGDCESWVDWYGQVVCDVEQLASLASRGSIDPSEVPKNITSNIPKLLPFDHVYPSPSRTLIRPSHTAILYGSLSSKNFRQLHSYLYAAVPRLEYVFRPIPPKNGEKLRQNHLSGYGVALDLKKMDYLALDDRHGGHQMEVQQLGDTIESIYDMDPVIALIDQYPDGSTIDSSIPLTTEEISEIGLKATQLIYDSEDKISVLKQLSQNFPKYAALLARRVVVDPLLSDEVVNNNAKAQPGISVTWLNGVVVPESSMNPFTLLRLLRKERRTILSLTSLGITSGQSFDLLTHPAITASNSGGSVLEGLFDVSDRPEDGGVIVWWNDFEKDSRYQTWGTSLNMLLRPLYPGQFPHLKFNLFNIVLAVDLSQTSSLNFIGATVSSIINRNFPFRFGVVPLVESVEGTQMAKLLYFLVEHFGNAKTLEFIRSVSQVDVFEDLLSPTVDWTVVKREFTQLLKDNEPLEDGIETDFEAIITGAATLTHFSIDKVNLYAQRLSTDLGSAPQGHAFVNGKHFDLDDEFLQNMQTEIGLQMRYIQEQVYLGKLENVDISNLFYDVPTTSKRRNKYVYPSSKTGSLRMINLVDLFESSGVMLSPGAFINPPNSELVPLTMYIVADLDSSDNSASHLVKEALRSMSESSLTRISFIHNPLTATDEKPNGISISSVLANLMSHGLLLNISPSQLLSLLDTDDATSALVENIDRFVDGVVAYDLDTGAYQDYITACRLITRELRVAPGEQALIVNGRVIGPVTTGDFIADDFKLLASYELDRRVQPVVDALSDIFGSFDNYDQSSYPQLIEMASSIVSAIQLPDPSESGLFNAPRKPRQRRYQLLDKDYTAYKFGDNNTALFHFGVILDPLSESAQKLSSIIEWLLTIPEVYLELYINPPKYPELPLKRFYRYNLHSRLSFRDDGNEMASSTNFIGLPIEPIYTLAMDVPSSWLVRPREALHDLDNIQLGSLSPQRNSRVQAIFDLDYLVVEGHARQLGTNAPPRGLQLQLTDSNGTPIADTQVVANLGYLQFRTKPGVFQLEIRPGYGRDIFKMESVGNEGWNSPTVDQSGNEVTLTSFEGVTLYPRLSRLPGMENADVLQVSRTPYESEGFIGDMISKLSAIFNPSQSKTELVEMNDDQAEINIFTVASGLLYERFASIMILSVLRNTNSSVKFWFIENFLSPSFLEFIPHFAEAYGFKYELVTYKWPSWLRAQKEKQRIIWAYKILFLDVLFPMDLKKVIFVDADQIVRADLKELVNLDLHGAPYGYTPMGDDNTDMEGFRFWKTGYWKDFLQGLPYHISALYVIDLVRFRQMAAGDILRGHYQQLSADPGSLANLDQDLPNNLQREVPIFSLPEDWLWCETWCSKDRLHRAKTIDLCQNPLTKEPKLARARQIPEWEEYDAEIARFARKLSDEGLIRSEMAAADANLLANTGSTTQPKSDTNDEEFAHDEL